MTGAAKIRLTYEPTVVLSPGESLAETLEELGMTQSELALRTGLSTKHINQIVNGTAPITSETALLLERATGVPARVWSNLEIGYREFQSRREEEARLSDDLGWLEDLPIRELARRGWIRKTGSSIDTLKDVCRFFGVANRSSWESLWHKPTAYRTSRAFNSDPGSVAAWLRIGEIEAGDIECDRFERTRLTGQIEEFRSLTTVTDPGEWWPRLVQLCAEAGVAVVAEPEIKGARINGAARWLTSDRALVQLSLRHRWNDIFWFTFFHEVGHLLLHSKKDMFINDVGAHSGVEQEADAFASQTLIPRQFESELSQLATNDDVKSFAARIGIAPGVVVGRLQHDQRWPFNHGNELKHRFVFIDD